MIITNNSAILCNNCKSVHKIARFAKISKPRKLHKNSRSNAIEMTHFEEKNWNESNQSYNAS